MTLADVLAHETRLADAKARKAGVVAAPTDGAPVDRESDLHEDIEADLKGRGWYYVHSRMDMATTTQLGVTDFIIAAPGGVTLWIEAKAKGNKPTPAQAGVGLMLKKQGHIHATVWNFEQYMAVIRSLPPGLEFCELTSGLPDHVKGC